MVITQYCVAGSLRAFFRAKPGTTSAQAKRLKAFRLQLAAAAPPSQQPPSTPLSPFSPRAYPCPSPSPLYLSVAPHALVELSDPLPEKYPAATTMTRSSTRSLRAALQMTQKQDRLRRRCRRSLLESGKKQWRSPRPLTAVAVSLCVIIRSNLKVRSS